MRQILGLVTAVTITAAVLISGMAPATASPSPSAPASSTSPATAKTAATTAPSPRPTSPSTVPQTLPKASASASAAASSPAPATSSAPVKPASPARPPSPAQPATSAAPAPTASLPAPKPSRAAPTTSHAPSAPQAPAPQAPAPAASKVPTPKSPAPSAPHATAAPFSAATPLAAPAANDAFVAQVLKAINNYRAANGAGPLVIRSAIGAGSQQWAGTLNSRINADTLEMNKAHRTDAGASILPKGYDMYSEIIAINGTAAQVVDWWMNSPAHRAALLDKRATDLGLGYVKTTKYGWSSMTVVVGNIAGYPESRRKQPQPQPVPVAKAGDIAVVDVDGGLYIYPSAKGGDLWQRKFISNGWSSAQQLVVTDYNGDGLADIIAIWKDGRLTVSNGQANGTLKPALAIGRGWAPFEIVVSPWTTGDKLPSILAKHRMSGDLRLYPNLDGARFGVATQIGNGWGKLTIVGADYDGDGHQDLLARNTAGQLILYRGTGTGGFVSENRRVIGSGWSIMTHISDVSNHLGTGGQGILARTSTGNLLHYPLVRNGWGTSSVIGTGGWSPLLLGS